MNIKSALLVSVLLATGAGLCTTAHADTTWQKKHPRREQVNSRLHRQDRRIHHEVKEGELSHGQAAALHKDDRKIRQEERDMASQNRGHLTKREQRTLNQQENQTSKAIGH